jgi:hypothetical protein
VGHKVYSTPLAKKLGIKDGSVVVPVNAPDEFARLLGGLPAGAKLSPRARQADVIVVFATRLADLKKRFGAAKSHLVPDGRLWMAYPKKSSAIRTDITFELAQEVGLATGLVDNKSIAVDEDWSGVQFVYRLADRPKPG